jgi:heme exporter protein B
MMHVLVAWHLRWLGSARDVLSSAFAGALAVGLAGALALHDAADRALAASAILWTVAAVAGLLAASRVLAAEQAAGGLRAMLLAPVDRATLFLARATTISLLVLALSCATWLALLPLFADLAALRDLSLGPPLVLGAAGLGIIGTLSGWAALSTRAGEVLGPVLGVPIAAPLLIALLHATETALASGTLWTASHTFALGYVLALGAAAYLVAGHVTEVP